LLFALQSLPRSCQGLLTATLSPFPHRQLVACLGQGAVWSFQATFDQVASLQGHELLPPRLALPVHDTELLLGSGNVCFGIRLPLYSGLYQPFLRGDAFNEAFRASPGANTGHGFCRMRQGQSLSASDRVPRMLLHGKPQSPIGGAVHAHQRRLVSQSHLVIHPAKGSPRIATAGVGHWMTREITVIQQHLLLVQNILHASSPAMTLKKPYCVSRID
jgi:hypothetical protein